MKKGILAIHENKYLQELYSQIKKIWNITIVKTNLDIIPALLKSEYDFLLFDIEIKGVFPLDLLNELTNRFPKLKIFIMLTGESKDLRLNLLSNKIAGVFTIPCSINRLYKKIEKAFFQNNKTTDTYDSETLQLKEHLIGTSKAMQQLQKFIISASRSELPVLILGETGCGKTLAANLIHKLSAFKQGKFININVSCIPESLAESILFGCEKGSFTGAEKKEGLFICANGGTIFLDEMESFPLSVQSKLLNVIETKQIRPIGALNSKKINFRLICAANKNLKQLVASQLFRSDLFYRLDVLRHTIPPLRNRKEDLLQLIEKQLKKTGNYLSDCALNKIYNYTWPGNIRELQNCLTRACFNAGKGCKIKSSHIEF